MFAPIYNLDFQVEGNGTVHKSERVKDFEFPEEIPPLKYISDLQHSLCLDHYNNLYTFNNKELNIVSTDVEHIVTIRDGAYFLTYDFKLFYFENNVATLILDDISWITTIPNWGNLEYCFAVSHQGEIFLLNNNNNNPQPITNIYVPRLEDIRFVRKNCIITNNNSIVYYYIVNNQLIVTRVELTIEAKDVFYYQTETPFAVSGKVYLLSRDNKLYYKLIGDDSEFREINSRILSNIGVTQFVSINKFETTFDVFQRNTYTFVLQAYEEYLYTIDDNFKVSDLEIFSDGYIVPYPSRGRNVKSARFFVNKGDDNMY